MDRERILFRCNCSLNVVIVVDYDDDDYAGAEVIGTPAGVRNLVNYEHATE